MISEDNLQNGTLTPLEAGTKISIQLYSSTFGSSNQNYYLAMKVYDHNLLESGLSNIARIMIRPKTLGGISGGQIAGVVIGSLLVGGFMIAVVAYYIFKK